jgi:hypothetical protein
MESINDIMTDLLQWIAGTAITKEYAQLQQ